MTLFNILLRGNHKYKKLAIIFALAIFLVALGQVVVGLAEVINGRDLLLDFQVYFEASLKFLARQNPYQSLYAETIPFNYPPSALLFFMPFTLLPIKLAQISWLVLQGACLVAGSHLLIKKFLLGKTWLEFILIALLIQNFPTKFTLVMGRANFLVLFLVIVSIILWWEKKDISSGLALGAAAAVKMTPLFLVVFFIYKKSFRVTLTCLAVFAAANLIFLVFRPELFTDFFFRILPSLGALSSQGHYYDQSFLATLARFGMIGAPAKMINAVILGVLGIGGISKINRKCKKEDQLADLRLYSFLLVLVTIFNSFAWQHHLVFLFPAFLWGTFEMINSFQKASFSPLKWLGKTPRDWIWGRFVFSLLLTISALLVGLHFRNSESVWLANPLIASHGFWGALILIGLQIIYPMKWS